jgi:hypothetical protein
MDRFLKVSSLTTGAVDRPLLGLEAGFFLCPSLLFRVTLSSAPPFSALERAPQSRCPFVRSSPVQYV